MMDRRYGILFATPIIFLSGCQPAALQTATQAIALADTLIKTYNSFQETSKLHHKSVNEVVAKTRDKLEPPKPLIQIPFTSTGKINLSEVANEWENRWKDVSSRSQELQKNLNDINQKSQEYWEKLESITNRINDSALREEQKEKNRELREKWNETYKRAKQNVNLAIKLNSKAEDFHSIMMLGAMRREVEASIVQLNSIADDASSLSKQIEEAAQQGREIIEKSKP